MNGNKLYYGFCGVLLVVVGAVLLIAVVKAVRRT